MSIVFQCAACRKRFKVSEGSGGKRVKCTQCGTVGTVPRATAGAATGTAPPPRPPPPPPPPGAGQSGRRATAGAAGAARAVAASGSGGVAKRAPREAPQPPPKEEEDDVFSAMADLERTGTADDEAAYAPPPPPPPGAGDSAGYGAAPRRAPSTIKPVAPPWVPKSLSYLSMEKPFHRLLLMILFGLFGLAGVVGAVIAYQQGSADTHFVSVAKQVTGQLYGTAVRNDIYRRRRANEEAYDVTYKFAVGGREYTGEHDKLRVEKLPTQANPHSSFDGQNATLSVYYDPDDPTKNRLFMPNPGFTKIVAALAVLCLPVGLFMAWRVFRYDRYARSIGA